MTLANLIESEGLESKVQALPPDADVIFLVKSGLDGSGSHVRRQQLSGDDVADANEVDNFVGVFVTPLSLTAENVCLWKNSAPNSVYMTRPVELFKAKENRANITTHFSPLQKDADALKAPHAVCGISRLSIRCEFSMIDGKMVDLLQGDSGSFCHYCHVSRDDASSIHALLQNNSTPFPISKTIQQCNEAYEKNSQNEFKNQDKEGQCHSPLLTEDGRYFAIMHQSLRSLDFMLKLLYHLMALVYTWSETGPGVKEAIKGSKAIAIEQIRRTCNGLLVDCPSKQGGTSNNGPTAERFFSEKNREAIGNLIPNKEHRDNYCILLGLFDTVIRVSQSVDDSKCLYIEKFEHLCWSTMLHISIHFPWVKITPSVHQMLGHNPELFQMQQGKSIAKYSESALEAWNKHIRAFRSGPACRARQNSAANNIHDVFVRMLIMSSPLIQKHNAVKSMLGCSPSVEYMYFNEP